MKTSLAARGSAVVLALSMFHAVPALATCPPLGLQPRFPLSVTSPYEVVVADFNRDGVPDLATTQRSSNSLGVFLGIAPGGKFGSRTDVAVGSFPQGLAVDDLDGDGKPDLVVSCSGAGVIQVLRGLGDGTFSAPVSFPAGDTPYEVATGDFNGDGVKDIAVADNNENSMRILIAGKDAGGHWDGTFAPSVRYATSDLPLSIVTGDFNNDGITDAVVTEYRSNTVALFLGNGTAGVGDGTFQPALHIPAGQVPYELATGDLNGDGKLDLIVAADGVHVLLGSGTGSFPVSNTYIPSVGCTGVAVADLDGDGINDLVACSPVAPNYLYLLHGNGSAGVGDGTFDPTPVTLGDCCLAIHATTADLNLDGKPEALTCDLSANTVSVFMNGCEPVSTGPGFFQTFSYPVGWLCGFNHCPNNSQTFNRATYDTSLTFNPAQPPDYDCYGNITSSLHYSGSSLYWQLGLQFGDLCPQNYTPTLQCSPTFDLYGLGPADTAIVNVRVYSSMEVMAQGTNGWEHGVVAITTNMGSDTHDYSHFTPHEQTTNRDTLLVPARILGSDPHLTFQLSMLNHIEESDDPDTYHLEVAANVAIVDVPPGMLLVNAYGYGAGEVGVAPEAPRPGVLLARANADGREITVRGVELGATGAYLALYDLAGRRLASARLETPATDGARLPVPAGLTSGIYFVRCTDSRGVRSTKFAFAR